MCKLPSLTFYFFACGFFFFAFFFLCVLLLLLFSHFIFFHYFIFPRIDLLCFSCSKACTEIYGLGYWRGLKVKL